MNLVNASIKKVATTYAKKQFETKDGTVINVDSLTSITIEVPNLDREEQALLVDLATEQAVAGVKLEAYERR